jgi:hypothetical protein
MGEHPTEELGYLVLFGSEFRCRLAPECCFQRIKDRSHQAHAATKPVEHVGDVARADHTSDSDRLPV